MRRALWTLAALTIPACGGSATVDVVVVQGTDAGAPTVWCRVDATGITYENNCGVPCENIALHTVEGCEAGAWCEVIYSLGGDAGTETGVGQCVREPQ